MSQASFIELAAELQGIPRLPYPHGIQLLNRAWHRILDYRLWSFNVIPDAQQFIPAVITGGSVSVEFGSSTMVADAAAIAAINAGGNNPPIGHPLLGIGRQIKIGSANTSLLSSPGINYSITAWDATNGIITIDKPYGQAIATGQLYQILKAYYAAPNYPFTNIPAAPDAGFVKYTSCVNSSVGYAIRGKNLYCSQAKLNAIDPYRGAIDNPYIIAEYGRNALGQPVHEWYPNPGNNVTFRCTYITRWPDLGPQQNLPQMPYELSDCLLAMAKALAGDWALTQVPLYPELGRTNWVAFSQTQRQEFKESLIQCIKTDDEIAPWLPEIARSSIDFPMGGQFLQSHDLSLVLGGLR